MEVAVAGRQPPTGGRLHRRGLLRPIVGSYAVHQLRTNPVVDRSALLDTLQSYMRGFGRGLNRATARARASQRRVAEKGELIIWASCAASAASTTHRYVTYQRLPTFLSARHLGSECHHPELRRGDDHARLGSQDSFRPGEVARRSGRRNCTSWMNGLAICAARTL